MHKFGVIRYMRHIKYTKEYLEDLVKTSICVLDVIRKIKDIKQSGANHRYISYLIKEKYKINTDHFNINRARIRNIKLDSKSMLVLDRVGRKEDSQRLRKAMVECGIKYQCKKCSNMGTWMGEELILEIDHINQNNLDNRPENLQFLCSNCHTQKCRKEYKKKEKIKSSFDNHAPKIKLRKVKWPSKEELLKLIWEKPTSQLAKDFGVSDVAISKWCKRYGITKPKRGYWIKKKFNIAV